MKKLLKILPVLAVFILCTMAYVPLFAQKDWKINTGILEISLRENEQELANRLNGGYEQIYNTGFISLGGYPKIRFKHGEHSFMLPDNSHVLASSQEGNGWGVTSIEVDAEFYRSDQPDKHLQARKKFLELLRELQAKGWKQYYVHGSPRIIGSKKTWDSKPIFNYLKYEPSEKEWKELFNDTSHSLSFLLYAEDIILKITLRGDNTEYRNGEAVYTISMEFEALEYILQGYSDIYTVDSESRFIIEKWLPMADEALQRQKVYRLSEEAKLKRQGIKIDESYQDPLPKIYTDYLKNKGKNTD